MSGRVVVVTGAARGVGREVALGFAGRGDRLALGDVDGEGVERTARDVRAIGAEAMARAADVSASAECDRLIEIAVSRWGSLDLLVNNAGVGLWGQAVELTDADWRRLIGVNLDGVVFCTRAALRVMLPRGRGQIITVCSDLGRVAAPNFAAYCASKFGVAGFTHAVAAEARPHGVKVSLLYPGIIDTAFRRGQPNRPPETIPEPSRMLTARDVAEAVIWMASTGATAVAGEVVLDAAR
ncbi:MAG TPA: SDR family oxidoreductase [Methylomirabilota bacterium]|nr:SDR family oxidoreductase [Methylomirabilota bacterium]